MGSLEMQTFKVKTGSNKANLSVGDTAGTRKPIFPTGRLEAFDPLAPVAHWTLHLSALCLEPMVASSVLTYSNIFCIDLFDRARGVVSSTKDESYRLVLCSRGSPIVMAYLFRSHVGNEVAI